MAGIGFELEKLFEKDTHTADLGAYLAAGLILAGSWVFSVMAILLVSVFSSSDLGSRELAIFLTMCTYSYAGAMLLTSLFSLPVTRFVADRLYHGEADSFGPSYAGYCLCHWIVAVIVGAWFYSHNSLSPTVRIEGIILLVACTQVWLSASFLSLLRAYVAVALSFLCGYTISTVAAIFLGQVYRLEGALGGFALGLCVLALMLTAHLQIEFVYPRAVNFGFLRTALTCPSLMGIGFFFAIGTWVDKVMIWGLDSTAQHLTEYLTIYPPYDVCFFLGYITAIPGYAHFLLRIETTFSRHVRHLYSSLVSREPYSQIHLAKDHLIHVMNSDFVGLLKVQLPMTLLCVYFAPDILRALYLPVHATHMLQFSALASLLVIVIQVEILYLLYFDLARAALVPAFLYGLGNAIFSFLSVRYFGSWTYGLGHLGGALLAATGGVIAVNWYVHRLDFITLNFFAGLNLKPTVVAKIGRKKEQAGPPDQAIPNANATPA